MLSFPKPFSIVVAVGCRSHFFHARVAPTKQNDGFIYTTADGEELLRRVVVGPCAHSLPVKDITLSVRDVCWLRVYAYVCDGCDASTGRNCVLSASVFAPFCFFLLFTAYTGKVILSSRPATFFDRKDGIFTK